MKPELKRIETALQQASEQYVTAREDLSSGFDRHAATDATHTLKTEFLDTNTSLLAVSAAAPEPVSSGYHRSLPSQENHRFIALTSSALSINLLNDLQTMVTEWAATLEAILQQVQKLYEEGPIVNGWLESCNATTTATYRLCGLNEDGQVWYRSCPPDQVPDISLAIVRYQRLQTLLTQKRSLESRLSSLTEALVNVHGKMAEMATEA